MTPVPAAAENNPRDARAIALSLLDQVLSRRQPLDQVLETDANFAVLSLRDRGFVRMTVATTLRRLGQVDEMIRQGSDHQGRDPSPPLLHHLLRMAAAQIVFMDVPDYATVDSAVDLADRAGLSRQKGFVNAVLRRITENHTAWRAKQDEGRLNVPEWLMKIWISDYGLRGAAEIAQACLTEAALDITIKNPAMQDHWAHTLDAAVLPTGTLRRMSGGLVQDLPGYADGMWWVQDAAAAIPAKLFGNVAGRHVIDLCAAPGGKTAQLAAAGALVTAIDRSTARLRRLEDNMRRVRLEGSVQVETADAAVWMPKEQAELVLLDAPCTATGTVRRHPDILHLKAERDMHSLMETQARLLENAVRMTAAGGVIVYCTCSLQKDEGERQIDRILSVHAGLRRVPVSAAELGGLETVITPAGDVRVLPFHLAAQGGMDGFYVARLQKI